MISTRANNKLHFYKYKIYEDYKSGSLKRKLFRLLDNQHVPSWYRDRCFWWRELSKTLMRGCAQIWMLIWVFELKIKLLFKFYKVTVKNFNHISMFYIYCISTRWLLFPALGHSGVVTSTMVRFSAELHWLY